MEFTTITSRADFESILDQLPEEVQEILLNLDLEDIPDVVACCEFILSEEDDSTEEIDD